VVLFFFVFYFETLTLQEKAAAEAEEEAAAAEKEAEAKAKAKAEKEAKAKEKAEEEEEEAKAKAEKEAEVKPEAEKEGEAKAEAAEEEEAKGGEEGRHFLSTVVTAFYNFGLHSKHGFGEYKQWLSNFLSLVEVPLVIYTDEAALPMLQEMRQGKTTEFVICPLWNISRISKYKEAYEGSQHDMDPEKHIHYPELYAVWNAKAFLVAEVAQRNPFHSTYFFWVDAGSFREGHQIRHWPDDERVKEIFQGHHHDRMLLGLINAPSQEDLMTWEVSHGPFRKTDMVEGGFFGGTAKTVQWWYESFFSLHDLYLEQGHFVGKDQCVMNVLALTNKDRVMLLDTTKKRCKDPWFYFQQVLANPNEKPQECQGEVITIWG